MTPLLEVRALQAGYGRRMVLHGIDLTMAAGEGLALIGHNGTGKSTLMEAICGVLRTGAGSVLLDGIDVTGLPPEAMVKRSVVHVPAGRRLFLAMTVRHNLEAGAFVRRDAAGIRADIEAMLHRFPMLSDKADRMAGLLSGAEQQALALARRWCVRMAHLPVTTAVIAPAMDANIKYQDRDRGGGATAAPLIRCGASPHSPVACRDGGPVRSIPAFRFARRHASAGRPPATRFARSGGGAAAPDRR
jgi:ABC-type branched-subunit amino acid transport system ATPase component